MAKTIHTDKAPAAIGPYVQGKIVGNLLFASGQVPLSPETGTDFDHVVKTTCFLSDINDFVPFNEVYATAFTSDFPARSAVEVARLPKDVKIEIEVIAEID